MSPIDTTTGLPTARSWTIARAMTSDANAEPPGLLTRSTTAPTVESARHSSSADSSVSEPATPPMPNGSSWLGPSTIVAVDQHDGDAAAGPGARARPASSPDRGCRPSGRPSALRDHHLQLALVGDAVDQPGGLRLRPA